jgi:hypothetical protein
MENKYFFFQPPFAYIKVKETNFKTYRKTKTKKKKKKKKTMIGKLSVKYIEKKRVFMKRNSLTIIS